ncbi:MAG TPA: trehalose-phosphatase, partial [Burkholderiales bacterium]|nr:trehalose-phosphatase [Burkholderiales bacterium]
MPPFQLNWAFFLDLDGTLLEIAETPDAVDADYSELALVGRLSQAAGGAVAVISGRALARIDQLLAPLVLPAA